MDENRSRSAAHAPAENATAAKPMGGAEESALSPASTAEFRTPRLLDRVRLATRVRHHGRRTERSHVGWTRRYVLFHQKRHPSEMGAAEVGAFLNHLATERKVSAATQNQALCALVFLSRHVLEKELAQMDGLVRAKRPVHLPVVLTPGEAAAVLRKMTGVTRLMGSLLYGSGLRLLECCRLRVKDIDFERRAITVRDGKGRKDRMTVLPAGLIEPLRGHLILVKQQHESDLRNGRGSVELPDAIERKLPRAAWEWAWQWVFPATRFHVSTETPISGGTAGQKRRHHLHESVLQRAVREATSLTEFLTACPVTRCAIHSPPPFSKAARTPRTIQELLGHTDVGTTIYTHVLNRGSRGVRCPLDGIL
jgi:integron integrase